jgi:hypothetical protein
MAVVESKMSGDRNTHVASLGAQLAAMARTLSAELVCCSLTKSAAPAHERIMT